QGALLVLDLRLAVLAGDDDLVLLARVVGDAHRRVGGVHRLPAGAARAVDVDAVVGGGEGDVDVVGLGQHRHRDGAGVDAPLRLGGGHALHAVHARLELEGAVGAAAGDGERHLGEAAHLGGVRVEQLGAEAQVGGVAQVH